MAEPPARPEIGTCWDAALMWRQPNALPQPGSPLQTPAKLTMRFLRFSGIDDLIVKFSSSELLPEGVVKLEEGVVKRAIDDLHDQEFFKRKRVVNDLLSTYLPPPDEEESKLWNRIVQYLIVGIAFTVRLCHHALTLYAISDSMGPDDILKELKVIEKGAYKKTLDALKSKNEKAYNAGLDVKQICNQGSHVYAKRTLTCREVTTCYTAMHILISARSKAKQPTKMFLSPDGTSMTREDGIELSQDNIIKVERVFQEAWSEESYATLGRLDKYARLIIALKTIFSTSEHTDGLDRIEVVNRHFPSKSDTSVSPLANYFETPIYNTNITKSSSSRPAFNDHGRVGKTPNKINSTTKNSKQFEVDMEAVLVELRSSTKPMKPSDLFNELMLQTRRSFADGSSSEFRLCIERLHTVLYLAASGKMKVEPEFAFTQLLKLGRNRWSEAQKDLCKFGNTKCFPMPKTSAKDTAIHCTNFKDSMETLASIMESISSNSKP